MKHLMISLFCFIALVGCHDNVFTPETSDESDLGSTKSATEGDYYWGSRGMIPITKSTSKAYVLFKGDSETMQRTLQKAGVPAFEHVKDYRTIIAEDEKVSEYLKDVKIAVAELTNVTSLLALDAVIYAAPYYKMNNGNEYPLTNEFIVELKDPQDFDKLKELALQNNVLIAGMIPLTGNAYQLFCTKDSKGNALEMANLFYETEEFISSCPVFISVSPE